MSQEYVMRPESAKEVNGQSSKTIYRFMTATLKPDKYISYPLDVGDFERNRALLLMYPEWNQRLHEMASLGPEWAALVSNWSTIMQLYDEDCKVYGNKAYGIGKCDKYIRSLLSKPFDIF